MSVDRGEFLSREQEVENTHIRDITELITPYEVKQQIPATKESIATTLFGREAMRSLLVDSHANEKLAVVVGPCSIHDPESALEYAEWIKQQRELYSDDLEIIMRVYFEKPRTTIGWKGLINDPFLDESYDINSGLVIARKLLVDITSMGVPAGTELLESMTPQYFGGLISWGAIGARTTESQMHRELASGLSFPVGFKNGTSGDVKVAVDAVGSAKHPHHFLAITDDGNAAIAETAGNPYSHVILRGGKDHINFDLESVNRATDSLSEAGHEPVVMVDLSHDNSGKDHTKQAVAADDVARQIAEGSKLVMGVMIESNLVEGKQPFNPNGGHEYGKSITDSCIGLDDTASILALLQAAVQKRKA